METRSDVARETPDEREWELSDEELERSAWVLGNAVGRGRHCWRTANSDTA